MNYRIKVLATRQSTKHVTSSEFYNLDANEGKVSVYVDHFIEPIIDWIEEENDEEGSTSSKGYDEDVDSIMLNLSFDHKRGCWGYITEEASWSPFDPHKCLMPKMKDVVLKMMEVPHDVVEEHDEVEEHEQSQSPPKL